MSQNRYISFLPLKIGFKNHHAASFVCHRPTLLGPVVRFFVLVMEKMAIMKRTVTAMETVTIRGNL